MTQRLYKNNSIYGDTDGHPRPYFLWYKLPVNKTNT